MNTFRVKRAAREFAVVAFLWIACAGVCRPRATCADIGAGLSTRRKVRSAWTSIWTNRRRLDWFDFDSRAGCSGDSADAISFDSGKGSFRLKGIPGNPTFTGTLSADSKSLEGPSLKDPRPCP